MKTDCDGSWPDNLLWPSNRVFNLFIENSPIGIAPMNKFMDKSNCIREFIFFISSGIDPFKRLLERSRNSKLGASIGVGISPYNLFPCRYKCWSLFIRKSSPGIFPDSAFKDKSSFSRFEQLCRQTGTRPDMLFADILIVTRFVSWHIDDGIVPLTPFLAKYRPVTTPEVHSISGQSHEDEFEVHELSEGGLAQCALKLSRIVCSEEKYCEFTWRWRGIRRVMKRRRSFAILLQKQRLCCVIFQGFKSYIQTQVQIRY